jgi:hypothetical protein
MSDTVQSNVAASNLYQKQFGLSPGSQDARAECGNWQRLCDGLLAERARLKAELEQLRLEQIFREWDQIPVPSWDEMQSQIDRSMTFEQLIEELEAELEPGIAASCDVPQIFVRADE